MFHVSKIPKSLLIDSFLDHLYCIEVTPHANKGDEIFILKNHQVIDTTPRLNDFNAAHRTCFNSFLPSDDIIELRNGGNDGVQISIELITNGIKTQLFFGENADLTSVIIDGNNTECGEQIEKTSAIKINDGAIIESECIGLFILITYDRKIRLFVSAWSRFDGLAPVTEIDSEKFG